MHPFDGVAPEVVVEGVRFYLFVEAGREDGTYAYTSKRAGAFFDGASVLIHPKWASATDYETEIRTGPHTVSYPEFNLSTPEGYEAFRRHLRDTRGGK